MRYYLLAGEASGDLHGAHLIQALKAEDADAQFRCWGGDLMQQAGGKVVKHYRDLAFMGFLEVARNLQVILRNFRFCKTDLQEYRPDVLILIDYPGFNLRMARWAYQNGLRVFYYISPQLWAWHSSRVHQIKKYVERLFVILPFEQEFYRQYDYRVDFVGHPLLDVVENFAASPDFHRQNDLPNKPLIALLPGSRRQEIARMLKGMLKIVPSFPDHHFAIAGAPSIELSFYEDLLAELPPAATERISLLTGQTYPLLATAEAALVTSGTATLEAALFDAPQVVCYRGNPLSYRIARRLVNVSYISLVNLIAGREVVKELIQNDFEPRQIERELRRILDPETARKIRRDYAEIRQRLGNGGASRRAAHLIVEYLRNPQDKN